MKKVLLFGAAILTAMSMSAKVYNFGGIQASDITTDGTIGTYTMDGVEIPSVSAGENTDINCTLNGMEDLVINYKNSSGKDNILKFAADYLQADGKNVILSFSNVTIGDEIILLVSAKGGTPSVFEALSGCEADANNPASVGKIDELADYVQVKFTATASDVQIKETSGGYRIISATVGSTESAIQNAIAEKISFNGNVISNVEGLNLSVYNVLGKLMVTSNGDIDMSAYQTGVYVVRAEGVKGALKIRK
ncbi:MAG: T9SS type A sorting domain-containing protein [Bacteroidetes bacterium]|uniref:T9SS type A sorting domain-containing protein n=1 Tax=Candidatus Gallipaludibacter merdavium TaxID=2840839 RepID=A0A9D9N532_9BACT|nr:T9SS type A sorting domain-containing protein [Candidatus Gallipaludibacter merdavium]